MTQIDKKITDDIDLLILSYMTLKVLSGEKIDTKSYYFKYYMNIMVFKIGITNITDIILPKEFYYYINGHNVKYDLLHQDGIDTMSIEPNILKIMLDNVKTYYFNECNMNFSVPSEQTYVYSSYFDHIKEMFDKKFETVVRTVDCVESNLKIKFLEKDLADSIKVENYELCAKIKKQIDNLKGS